MSTVAPGFRPDTSRELSWTVDEVLASPECVSLIARGEALGFSAAPITTSAGLVMRPDVRNNMRVMFEDGALAAELFERVKDFLPATLSSMELQGVNERFRFYRYSAGERFNPHFDGAFVRNEEERSLLTFMTYLNHDFTGGETRFVDEGKSVEPHQGRALFFQHRLRHEGSVVTSGTKYVLRTDVMYRKPPPA